MDYDFRLLGLLAVIGFLAAFIVAIAALAALVWWITSGAPPHWPSFGVGATCAFALAGVVFAWGR